jgi:hypothetical protein
VRYTLRAVRSDFSEEKKLSMAELSNTLTARLMLQVTPSSPNQALELLAGGLAAPIRVMHQCVSLATTPYGHHQLLTQS